MPEIAAILRSRLGRDARRVPTHDIPDWLVRVAAKVVPPLRELADLTLQDAGAASRLASDT